MECPNLTRRTLAFTRNLSRVTFALGLVLLCEQALQAAEAPFPRGPGYYFHPAKFIFLLAIYLGWVATCNWVDRDARNLEIESPLPAALMIACGLAGLVLIWVMPAFWLGWLSFLFLYAATTYLYVRYRNQKVDAGEQLLTEDHLRDLLKRYLRLDFRPREDSVRGDRLPVRFMSRTKENASDDGERGLQIQESKGYKGALEMVYEAVQKRATDIHLEPTKTEIVVRFRVDGIMTGVTPFTRPMGDAVVNIFKVLCTMDITEKRKPQDGSFSAEVNGRTVDFRVATAGSVVGEKLVMRILDKSLQIIDLTQLGMRDKMRDQIRDVATKPHGMLIVCGPTGSGKSTTLYACLNEIDRFQQNIITIENPVEYQLANVTQIEVNQKAGKTFASELRSILRQDPDIIMIGEIRDRETAEIACQAAQTGHFVFTTLHANDTVTAIGRLIDLGVQPFMIASALTAVLGQRLVRQLCPTCKVRYKPNPEMLRKANLPIEKIKYFYRPPQPEEVEAMPNAQDDGDGLKCPTCGGTGYFKRSGLFEFLLITDKVRELIRESPNLNIIRQEAVKGGMRYLYEDGLRKVLEGETSIQELLRVSK